MSNSINKVILVGNVGKDPDIRSTKDGIKIASFPLATTESWRDKASGERNDKTEWHRVVVFNERLAEVVEQYVKRGDKLYMEGKLQTRKWQDSNTGVDRYTTEVVLDRFGSTLVMLGGAGAEGSRRGGELGGASSMPEPNNRPEDDDFMDEIPF